MSTLRVSHFRNTLVPRMNEEHYNYLVEDKQEYKNYCESLTGEGAKKLKSYPVFNGYEKRPIDFLRNVTDVATPLLQMIVKETYCSKVNENKVFEDFVKNLRSVDKKNWREFAISNRFDDLNILLKLMKKNCVKMNISTLIPSLHEIGIKTEDDYFFETMKLFHKGDPSVKHLQDVINGENEKIITTDYTLTYLIQACRNLFAHQGYIKLKHATTSKSVLITMMTLYKTIEVYANLIDKNQVHSPFKVLLPSVKLIIDVFRDWKEDKENRVTMNIFKKKEFALELLDDLRAAIDVTDPDPKVMDFAIHVVGSRLSSFKETKARYIEHDDIEIGDLNTENYTTVTLKISDLDTRITESQLYDYFSVFNQLIKSIVIFRDGDGNSTGIAHLEILRAPGSKISMCSFLHFIFLMFFVQQKVNIFQMNMQIEKLENRVLKLINWIVKMKMIVGIMEIVLLLKIFPRKVLVKMN